MALSIKRKKYLLASGCSYTDPKYKTPDNSVPSELRVPYTMWPEFLGLDLNLNVLNLGKSGNSNYMIYRSILDAINKYEDRVDTIAVFWSGWDRTEIFHYWNFQSLHYLAYHSDKSLELDDSIYPTNYWVVNAGLDKWLHAFKNSFLWDPYLFIKESINQSLILMQSLLEICKSRNIKCILYQGVNPMDLGLLNRFTPTITGNPHNKEFSNIQILNALKQCSSFKYLEENHNNIIGWPFFPELGGYHFDSLRYSPGSTEHYWVSKKDHHPNVNGQRIIADHFLEKYRKIYD